MVNRRTNKAKFDPLDCLTYCGVARRPGVRRLVSGLRKLSRGVSSASRPILHARPFRCLPDCLSRARPSGTLRSFPYCWVFYDGGSGPPRGQRSSIFSLVPTSGVYLQSVPSVCRLSHRPSPNKNPAFLWQWRVPSGLPASWSQSEQQSFSSALTRLLVMTGSFPHRSHAHLTTPCSRHATADPRLICLLSVGAAHLTLVVWSGRLTSYLYSAHKSDFRFSTPEAWLRHRESYLALSLASQYFQWPSSDSEWPFSNKFWPYKCWPDKWPVVTLMTMTKDLDLLFTGSIYTRHLPSAGY